MSNFIEQIAKYVVKYAHSYGIAVHSPIIAQAILESASGTSELAMNAHNYFGLKYRKGRCKTCVGIYTKVGSEQNADGSYTSSSMEWCKFTDMENGVIGYFDFHNTGDGYDCGYCFLSSYHGKGFAREGFQTLLELLNKKGVKKFTAGTALDNAPSVKLLLSLGFKLTGTERVSFYKDTSNAEISFDGGRYELTPAERISISAFPSRSSAPHTI